MRKVILFISLFATTFCYSQNTWRSLGANDFVSRLALQDAINNSIISPTYATLTTGDFITKGQITSYCQCNAVTGTSTDFITKSQVVSSIGSLNTRLVYYSTSGSGYTSSSSACTAGSSPLQSIGQYYAGTFSNGSCMYNTSSGGNPYVIPYGTWYYDATLNSVYQLSNNSNTTCYQITNLTSCATVPYYTNASGTYPTIGGAGTSSSGTVINNSGATIYLYAVYNSAGATSGTASFSYGYGPSWTEGGTITTGGQTFVGVNYQTLTNGSSVTTLSLTKNDAIGTGAGVRWAYSTTIGGALTTL